VNKAVMLSEEVQELPHENLHSFPSTIITFFFVFFS